MFAQAYRLNLIVHLLGLSGVLMFPVSVYAYAVQDFHNGRVFFYSSIVTLILTAFLAIATFHNPRNNQIQDQLWALFGAYLFLPVALALPLKESLIGISYLDSYFEMLSSLTTTGATLFNPADVPEATHLWRAIVGWLGGFIIWVAAVSILAPMNLGGFELTQRGYAGRAGAYFNQMDAQIDPMKRILRHASDMAPVYIGLTAALWIFLMIVGENAFVALCHAMSTLSTSGISPVDGMTNLDGGIYGEVLVFIFLFFAVSRITFAPERQSDDISRLRYDPEFRMAIILTVSVPLLLFLRHWFAAYEVNTESDLMSAIRAHWGAAFTVLSFLTTTGFASAEWGGAQIWSGLETPGLILVGIALIGGGVATTAGGVKLLRVFALYQQGVREMKRLSHPSVIVGRGSAFRFLRTEGARIAWVFFMLFAMTIGGVMILLSLFGIPFDEAIVLTVATLSNVGPLAQVGANPPISYADIQSAPKLLLGVVMIIGRLETLAIIALISGRIWRN